jgi:CheY-like chemotaxis protein
VPDPIRILAVDDNRLILRLLALMLEEVGFEVVPADSAEAALALARADPPDLCIVDQEMPDRSGADLVRTMRWSGDARLRRMPVVGLSAYPQAERELRAAGACAFLRKPIEDATLLEAVLAALAPRPGPSPAPAPVA